MHVAVDIGLQRIASEVYDDFMPQEIDIYLNRATTKFTQARRDLVYIGGQSPQALQAADDLRTITKILSINLAFLEEEVFEGLLPADYEFYLDARTLLAAGWKKNVKVTPLEFSEYATSVSDRPLFDALPVLPIGTKLRVIRDSADGAVTKINLVYLRVQLLVKLDTEGGGAGSRNSELPPHTHQTIVDIAVELMQMDLKITPPQQQR